MYFVFLDSLVYYVYSLEGGEYSLCISNLRQELKKNFFYKYVLSIYRIWYTYYIEKTQLI